MGDDIEMGQQNPAGAGTHLNATQQPGANWNNGDFVFQLGPSLIEPPPTLLNGFKAQGHSIGSDGFGTVDGLGVVGLGNKGVVGQGTVGVVGQVGVSNDVPPLPPNLENTASLVSTGVFGSSLGGGSSLTAGVVGQSDVGFGVYGVSQNGGVLGVTTGGAGVFGHGGGPNSNPGTAVGVFGEAGGGDNRGVEGHGRGTAAGVAGFGESGGIGVTGEGGASGVSGFSNDGLGVVGQAGGPKGIGVVGTGTSGGVAGFGGGAPGTAPGGPIGVYGQGGQGSPGVFGQGSGASNGVEGHVSGTGAGVAGFGQSFGVHGEGQALGVGVSGSAPSGGTGVQASGGIGLFASGGFAAGFFDGKVVVVGDLVVTGKKSAAIRHTDGSHRLLYAVESPESWFEDFGEGRLVKGTAKVKLEPSFASVIKTSSFHVFLTPYGDSNGLYVSQRSKQGFEVSEQGKGKGGVSFSYRVVAKRKDIDDARLAKIVLPKVKAKPFVSKAAAKLKNLPELPKLPEKIAVPKVKPKRMVSKRKK